MIIRVAYHHEDEGWWADSQDVPGWTATASSVDELRQLVEEGVRFALDDAGVVISHVLEGAPHVSGLSFDFISGKSAVRERPGVEESADRRLVGAR